MITATELFTAFTRLHPSMAIACSEDIVQEYLESNPLVAACSDLKYVTNLFTDWYLSTL